MWSHKNFRRDLESLRKDLSRRPRNTETVATRVRADPNFHRTHTQSRLTRGRSSAPTRGKVDDIAFLALQFQRNAENPRHPGGGGNTEPVLTHMYRSR